MKIAEIMERLSKPIPRELIQKKPTFSKGKKSGEVDSISWIDTCQLLDQRSGKGSWSWQIDEVKEIGQRLVLTGTLTIYGDDRTISMSASGSESLNVTGYGDPSSNAEAMCFKRAACRFGLGRNDLWKGKRSSSYGNQSKSSGKMLSREEWLKRRESGAFIKSPASLK
jgi:hypothetical protein